MISRSYSACVSGVQCQVSSKASIWDWDGRESLPLNKTLYVWFGVEGRVEVHEIYGRVRDLIAHHLEVVAEQQLPGSLRHARERTDQASSVASSTTGAVPLEIGPWRRGLGRVVVGFLDLEGVRPRSA